VGIRGRYLPLNSVLTDHCSRLRVCLLFFCKWGTDSRESANWSKEGADKLVKLWNAYTGEIIRTFDGHKEGVSDIAWSSDGEYLASASDDKTIIVWSLELVRWFRRQEVSLCHTHESPLQGSPTRTLIGHTNFVFCLNYNPNANLLVSGGFDETVRVWDVARGKMLLSFLAFPLIHNFSHYGRQIVESSSSSFGPRYSSEFQP